MTISVENCWLVVFPEEMVVLNFFCAHTTAHSSALKLLAFLCLLFLSRVIFPFVWYIASVRLYFEILVSAYIGLLLLWIYIFDCNNRKVGKGVIFTLLTWWSQQQTGQNSPVQISLHNLFYTKSASLQIVQLREIFAYAQTWTGVQKYTKL